MEVQGYQKLENWHMHSLPLGKSTSPNSCGRRLISHSHTSLWTQLLLVTGLIRPPSQSTIHTVVLGSRAPPSMAEFKRSYK